MAYKLFINPAVEKELEEILEWYFERNKNLTIIFLKEYDESLGLISENPELFQKSYEKTKILDSVYILAVLHTKRFLD